MGYPQYPSLEPTGGGQVLYKAEALLRFDVVDEILTPVLGKAFLKQTLSIQDHAVDSLVVFVDNPGDLGGKLIFLFFLNETFQSL